MAVLAKFPSPKKDCNTILVWAKSPEWYGIQLRKFKNFEDISKNVSKFKDIAVSEIQKGEAMDEKKTCPSASCTEGAQLIGIMNQEHEFNFLKVPLPITKSFFEEAVKHGSPEKRFRFASKCVQSSCNQWTGSQCGISDRILDSIDSSLHKSDLPDCTIRPSCCWFFQNGELACRVCPLVATNAL